MEALDGCPPSSRDLVACKTVCLAPSLKWQHPQSYNQALHRSPSSGGVQSISKVS